MYIRIHGAWVQLPPYRRVDANIDLSLSLCVCMYIFIHITYVCIYVPMVLGSHLFRININIDFWRAFVFACANTFVLYSCAHT